MIHEVHLQAFAPSTQEARLVDELRAEGATVADLCLVAVQGEEVAGHICLSRAQLDSGSTILVLAPMSMLPGLQRQGVGSALVREALNRARQTEFPLVSVLGHPAYYPRFGFEPAGPLGLVAPFEVPPEAWMAHRLPAYRADARGEVVYAGAFGGQVRLGPPPDG